MPRFAPLTGLLLSIAACACADARAENSFGIVSDYRYRGLSLSDGEPGLQAGLVWDRDDGWYAGVFAATTRIGGRDGVQAISYLGRAWRLCSGRSWEAGIQYVAFTSDHGEDYRELYLGLASDRWNARLHYEPLQLGDYGPAAYADFNANRPLGERFVLVGHVGAGWRSGDPAPYIDRVYYDARVGIGMSWGAANLSLQRVATIGRGGYLAGELDRDAGDGGWVLSISRTW